ncbi:MAG: archaeosortase/exosortase family protein, partial [Methylotenera sp.]|nr:archaeosortase/exosortase family protein [Methylotenera sp.]
MAISLATQNKIFPVWFREWWPILLGLVTLYVPTYYNLSMGIWGNEDQAHGPIVLMVILYLFWQNREQLHPNQVAKTWPVLGSL